MKITDHIQDNAMGNSTTYKLFEPIVPSKNYLIFLHGKGEVGPADGSNLSAVSKLGYTKHATSGFEFPFNIIAPQAVTSFNLIKKFFPGFVKMKYKADTIIVTGLSMGGIGTFDMKFYDDLNLVYAIAPVCGGHPSSNASKFPEMPGWAFHGENDTIVRYTQSKNFVDAYNNTHTSEFKYTLYPGVGHNAWDKAYSVTPGQDELLQWIIQKFNEAPKPVVDLDTFKAKVIECVKAVN
jgi:predicted peptidase